MMMNKRTCAALLKTGVGLPLFQLASTISSRDLPSRSVPAICLFMLSTYARWCLPVQPCRKHDQDSIRRRCGQQAIRGQWTRACCALAIYCWSLV